MFNSTSYRISPFFRVDQCFDFVIINPEQVPYIYAAQDSRNV